MKLEKKNKLEQFTGLNLPSWSARNVEWMRFWDKMEVKP
jgi:hypothetical protein